MAETIESYLAGREKQLALARLQDSVVAAVYEIDNDIVMHGGTAIWRCYNGNRFSEDIDIYLTEKQAKKFGTELTWALSRHGVKMEYPRTTRIVNVFNDLARTKIEGMRMEARRHPVQREYARVDGSKFYITTLSVDEFLIEKMYTYSKRRYMRDIYDIYQLVGVEEPSGKVMGELAKFMEKVEKPVDERGMVDLVYAGVAPSFETVVDAIRRRVK
jgi:predicted nucleotidyltransferase component of viral defense system